MQKLHNFHQQYRRATVLIQCCWRQKLAKRALRNLKHVRTIATIFIMMYLEIIRLEHWKEQLK